MSKRDEFLKKQKILHLATLDKKNNPHIVPVWYLFDSKKFYIGTNLKTEKAKNIKNNNKISFCVDIGINSPDIFGVMGQGIAKLIRDKNDISRIEKRILLRYFKTLDNKSAKDLLEETDCIIEITPKKYSVWKY
ncbi:Pyridoxamine 5'-phosphate oxidase protein [Marine Group I thaumarchaeote SCGC AAA799-D07]|jgi:nitroimidazol reductase NimA-like FMN-containing flavoprotein (pyridoxamine 5'-phosphate oxidase superfamily)|nr:Pyridoxamine 5'-phosphate oxidase protein [Marine Group I thaumarchaeote SCGC AAA799-D07]